MRFPFFWIEQASLSNRGIFFTTENENLAGNIIDATVQRATTHASISELDYLEPVRSLHAAASFLKMASKQHLCRPSFWPQGTGAPVSCIVARELRISPNLRTIKLYMLSLWMRVSEWATYGACNTWDYGKGTDKTGRLLSLSYTDFETDLENTRSLIDLSGFCHFQAYVFHT